MTAALRALAAVAVLILLSACGGGGGSGPVNITPPLDPSSGGHYTPGVFKPSSAFAARCASPRAGTLDQQGSATDENNFLRSWTNELYLWYGEVPDIDPSNIDTLEYFDQLKTPQLTPSGQPKDKFHFTFDTAEWEALSQSGVEVGYGAAWVILAPKPPRKFVVGYIEPGSPAAAAGLTRGVEVITADGIDVVNNNTSAGIDAFVAAFFPEAEGETHSFLVRELSGNERTVNLTSGRITSTPVQNVKTIGAPSGARIGYIQFNDHIATSERQLIEAVETLNTQGIDDLVLDIRYNGGGFLDIASELAYMIGGSQTAGRVFERLVFNDKYPSTNPVTGEPLTPTPFHTTTGITAPFGEPLPTLNLNQVYVLTGTNTCSASESIINGLRGVDVQVYQIGSRTCGKPYGFYPQDNCGTTYFSIEFKGVNEKGFGDYTDGFSPQNTAGVRGELLPGCSVADDFEHALGDPQEGRFAAAIAFRDSGNMTCPASTGFGPNLFSKPGQPLSATDGVMPKSPWRENRIMGRP